jgi:hypothetical protein
MVKNIKQRLPYNTGTMTACDQGILEFDVKHFFDTGRNFQYI